MSPIVSGGGSGGSQPNLKQAVYAQHNPFSTYFSVASGADIAGPWARLSGGTEDILNLADPSRPIVPADGWYTFHGIISLLPPAQPGKYMQCSAEADADDWATGGNVFPVELDNHGSVVTTGYIVGVRVGFSEFLQAGQRIGWFVYHDAGIALDFAFYGLLICVTGISGQVIT